MEEKSVHLWQFKSWMFYSSGISFAKSLPSGRCGKLLEFPCGAISTENWRLRPISMIQTPGTEFLSHKMPMKFKMRAIYENCKNERLAVDFEIHRDGPEPVKEKERFCDGERLCREVQTSGNSILEDGERKGEPYTKEPCKGSEYSQGKF